ncbi:multicopy suppressor of BFA (Brefeldin A) [Entomophthora muscae]|uniref:Multicopy suppressor of BFA (Brefeldin A) n=1 Tax=Entomophthora muscae TaxID=34485 RepID=A0ACC2SA22_9FUNG|nr:multicopy suppressor of BFA (Brefeldin A) [Entomophthora muscae]
MTTPAPVKKTKVPQKPDPSVHRKALDESDRKINELKKKKDDITKEIDNFGSNKKGDKDPRAIVRKKLADLREEQAKYIGAKKSKIEEITSIQASLKKKLETLKSLQTKVPFKTLEDMEDHVQKLERQVESGKLKIIEEKRVLAQISQLKRNKKTFETLNALEDGIDEDRQKLDALRAQIDEEKIKSINSEYDTLKEELEKFNISSNEEWSSKSKLIEKRDLIKKDIDALYDARRELISQFKEKNDEFYNWRREDMKRRQEQSELRKQQEEKEMLAETAAEERALAALPAFENEISQCKVLLAYFAKLTNASLPTNEEDEPAPAPLATPIAAREIDASNVPQGIALTKKSDRDDVYFSSTKSKKPAKKATKSNAAKTTFTIPLGVMESLMSVKVPIPNSAADATKTLSAIQDKIQYYRDNQAKVTEEKKAKVELKIKALYAKHNITEEDAIAQPPTEAAPETAA